MTFADRVERYAKDVTSGRVLACRLIVLSCQRHLDDREAEKTDPDYPYYFDAEAVEEVCEFIELLPHVKGRWAANGELLVLQDWQVFKFGVSMGWKRRSDGFRRFRKVYVEVARKNAKSTGTAGLALYHFAADGEYGAEVYPGAGTEKQAWEVFGPARLMADKTPALREAFGIEVGAKNLHIPGNNSRFEPVIGKPGDGASPSFSVTDEYHEHATAEQLETMITGMGARDQPMAWVITTAGDSIESPCYDLRNDLVKVLEGTIDNPELFGLIYTIDEGDPWDSPESLAKANPNIGVSVREGFLLSQLREAINNPRKQSTYKKKHLNVWGGAAAAYFNLEKWKASADPKLLIDDFVGETCSIGLDLAYKLDLVASLKLFVREIMGACGKCRGSGAVDESTCPRCGGEGEHLEDHFFPFLRSYVPEKQAEAEERAHYRGWSKDGWLTLTAGNMTDYDEVEEDLVADFERFPVGQVGFDPHNAAQLVTHLMNHGLECVEVPQTVRYLSEPMKWVQALIEDGRFHHDGNPVLAWGISNVTAQEDRNANVFPRKEKPENKIDPATALIIAMGRYMDGDAAPPPQVLLFSDGPTEEAEEEVLW